MAREVFLKENLYNADLAITVTEDGYVVSDRVLEKEWLSSSMSKDYLVQQKVFDLNKQLDDLLRANAAA